MTIGRAITTWAMTIAQVVYSRRNDPRGPLRVRKSATSSPTTTGGAAMPVLMRVTTKRRPRKLLSATTVPNGTPAATAKHSASPETQSVRRAIW